MPQSHELGLSHAKNTNECTFILKQSNLLRFTTNSVVLILKMWFLATYLHVIFWKPWFQHQMAFRGFKMSSRIFCKYQSKIRQRLWIILTIITTMKNISELTLSWFKQLRNVWKRWKSLICLPSWFSLQLLLSVSIKNTLSDLSESALRLIRYWFLQSCRTRKSELKNMVCFNKVDFNLKHLTWYNGLRLFLNIYIV